jgi:uncharacterized membrane protein
MINKSTNCFYNGMEDHMDNQSKHNHNSKRDQFINDKSKSNKQLILSIVVIGILSSLVYLVIKAGRGKQEYSSAVQVQQSSLDRDEIIIPFSDVSSGQAKFFDQKVANDKSVRFFVIKTSDDKYRVALDACEVCFHAKKGYKQEGERMVCRNCGRSFDAKLITSGKTTDGCHPIGIAHREDQSNLVIRKSALDKGAEYF